MTRLLFHVEQAWFPVAVGAVAGAAVGLLVLLDASIKLDAAARPPLRHTPVTSIVVVPPVPAAFTTIPPD